MGQTREPTNHLLDRAERGEQAARELLLERYRDRLKRSVALRLDDRLAARLDASDIVQETLATVARRLDDYLRERPMPFLDWLKRLAKERVVDAHRTHLFAQRRSVARENLMNPTGTIFGQDGEALVEEMSDQRERAMVTDRLVELEIAMDLLRPKDREIVVMRHLEHRSPAQIAEILGINEGAAKVRIVRALIRLREILEEQ